MHPMATKYMFIPKVQVILSQWSLISTHIPIVLSHMGVKQSNVGVILILRLTVLEKLSNVHGKEITVSDIS
jgi:hypothetical protein